MVETGRTDRPFRGGWLKILIVDDDRDMVEILEELLTSSGHRVEWAYSKSEGMEKVKDRVPDLIILDVVMETEDAGLLFLEEKERDQDIQDIPVIILSAIHSLSRKNFYESVRQKGLKFHAFLEKPLNIDALLEVVERVGKGG